MYDAIVVGARCAGAATALLLARRGYRVLLLDRRGFPSDTLSTLYIHQPGVALLYRWGVLPGVVSSGCPPIGEITYRTRDIELRGSSWPADGNRAAYAPRRYLLDTLLVEAAAAAGAEVRQHCAVRDLVFDDDAVAGVVLADGTVLRSRLVVGADGMRSTVAAKAGARDEVADPTLTCAYYTFWSGLPARFRLLEAPGRWVGTVPTNDRATLVAAYFPQQEFPRVRQDALASLLAAVDEVAPEVREEMASGQRLEQVRGTGDQRNFFRTAAGPGWVLVGDAGHHKDSITARGITDAFGQAQLLADLLGDDLREPARLARALAGFATRRTELLMPDYRNTIRVAELAPSPHQDELIRLVASDQGLTDRYFSTLSGVCPIDEFVTPELLDLMAQAQH